MVRVRWGVAIASVGLLVGAGLASPATGSTTTERSVSILIFPKIVYDGTRDTFIQISNTSNSMVHARCFYVNAAPICPGVGSCLEGTCNRPCEPQWQEVDFNIWLTKQQPTHWAASLGRLTDLTDDECNWRSGNYECEGAGIDPGRVPPVAFPFTGELRCIEVDQSGAPLSGNHLKGEATIVTRSADASTYNAVGIRGEPFVNDGDNVLCLGGGVTPECPWGAEYQGCAAEALLTHFAEGADDPLLGPTSEVLTEVTIVPCRADLEHQDPTRITVQFLAVNEFEQPLSASTSVECWRSFFLRDVSNIFDVRATQSRLIHTSMRPVVPHDGRDSGLVAVFEEFHVLGDVVARAVFNVHETGEYGRTELIILPAGP